MKPILLNTLTQATRLTRAGRLAQATALLRGMANPQANIDVSEGESPRRSPAAPEMAALPSPMDSRAVPQEASLDRKQGFSLGSRPSALASLETLRALRDRLGASNSLPLCGMTMPFRPSAPAVPLPQGASFEQRCFSNPAGSRDYKLYVPSGCKGQSVPLVVMLHGCTQSPDDFAAGTRMNELAEAHRFLVAYPEQSPSANAQKCWNWFRAGDQVRGQGEPSIISGLTREIMSDFPVDPVRVFIAGLSAGGATAAIMGSAYPELYAAIGVHSGLAPGAANDMPSAFSAMRQGAARVRREQNGSRQPLAVIVFHGDADHTVNAMNGEQIIEAMRADADLRETVIHGQASGGIAYTRTVRTDAHGDALSEHWVLKGAGHAWSGGSSTGSYTEPRGPDASREMIRFFLR
jgi:poly(hydroxyalkanoate) depolymerase family esterase